MNRQKSEIKFYFVNPNTNEEFQGFLRKLLTDKLLRQHSIYNQPISFREGGTPLLSQIIIGKRITINHLERTKTEL